MQCWKIQVYAQEGMSGPCARLQTIWFVSMLMLTGYGTAGERILYQFHHSYKLELIIQKHSHFTVKSTDLNLYVLRQRKQTVMYPIYNNST